MKYCIISSLRLLLKEIKDLPITEERKLKVKNLLSPEISVDAQEAEIRKTVEILLSRPKNTDSVSG